ncbi:hypothetical protein PHLGIDRAFT_253223 [Phlebiopsis gigantea 11061_1 CR5-6]|uniref:Uncharacterized protein n=1 Tax=Phlebiopsis gigantea (strain 11061_1 CR5-6) TaxID=745531 RepID=A0A0C3RS90_PHLG1|nr:hypothetical protein PHLGIDRAFT_253223 [Phlebiopsis gigantea 11061_1 CR5-6]
MPPRTVTGDHTLLPAADATNVIIVPLVPSRTFLEWTFGRGTVIWRIWPAVVMYTAWAALVVTLSLKTRIALGVPNVLVTLLGVILGFVISYRAMSGYDRYWQGRSLWTDVIRTTRTFARLVWYHVPLRVDDGSDTPSRSVADVVGGMITNGKEKNEKMKVVHRVMAEKRMALGLIEGFAVALKHHLRGEKSIYYQDLYPLVKPLHEYPQHAAPTEGPLVTIKSSTSTSSLSSPATPVIPPINGYGTISSTRSPAFPSRSKHASHASISSHNSDSDERGPLLPDSSERRKHGLISGVSSDMIPFSGFVEDIAGWFTWQKNDDLADAEEGGADRRPGWTHAKHRPRIAGGRQNTPLQIVRSLTCWLSVWEERNCVPGNTLGNMFGCLASFESSLADMERILTTPLPFMFSAHINTVQLYLFALPFQLIDQFHWYTIPGVGIAAFIYLGFVATGEEIEQPFGYDDNDLDLDLFCREVIHADMEHLKQTPNRNAWLGARHPDDAALFEQVFEENRLVRRGLVEEAFGVMHSEHMQKK